jgi:hypothetical protein
MTAPGIQNACSDLVDHYLQTAALLLQQNAAAGDLQSFLCFFSSTVQTCSLPQLDRLLSLLGVVVSHERVRVYVSCPSQCRLLSPVYSLTCASHGSNTLGVCDQQLTLEGDGRCSGIRASVDFVSSLLLFDTGRKYAI